jgi:phage terminase large subunit-like protein
VSADPDLKISPIEALAWLAPNLFDDLTDAERLVLPFLYELWRRPDQNVSRDDWMYLIYVCGRGKGKTFAIGTEVNRRVECGEAKSIGLMAPTEPRVEAVQIATLIATAPPWFKPERYLGGLIWPNGVMAEVHTAIEPERSRSSNFDLTWLTEIVDWQHTTRWQAFKTITTATRIGRAQVIADTTSKGRNEVIEHLLDLHAQDPRAFPMIRGTTFDNPLLAKKYLKAECQKYVGQEFGEEIMGLIYRQAAGASFKQKWLDMHRHRGPLPRLVRKVVSVDPALVSHEGADKKGIVGGGDDGHGHVYILGDYSDRLTPEQWGDVVVRLCAEEDYAGAIVETNHMGEQAAYTIKSRAAIYRSAAFPNGLVTRILKDDGTSFPRRQPGIILIREKYSRTDKQARAGGPASETEAGHVHLCGVFPELETQLTTYITGQGRSPNQYDAYNYLVTELCDLAEEVKRLPKVEAAQAEQAQAMLRTAMLKIGAGRTI